MIWLRYVPHDDVPAYLAKGWRITSDLAGSNHGNYSVLMQWEGDSEPE